VLDGEHMLVGSFEDAVDEREMHDRAYVGCVVFVACGVA
jgi:hypothetical protein